MKFLTPLLLSCLLSISCNNADCITDDPIFRSLFVKLVDADGNNLIENDTFDSEAIVIRFAETTYTGVVFNDVPSLENLIILNLLGPERTNSYEVQLSESRLDTLELSLIEIGKDDPCGFSYFIPEDGSYNGIDQTIEDFGDDFLMTVVI